jgi:nucleoside-triphosphatase THEP1
MNDFGTLAAIAYQTGFQIDEFLAALARRLQAEGVRLGGVVQENAGAKDACAAMTLVDLASNGRFHISQDLGTAARGCRLDPRGLAEAESPLATTMGADPDLIILNKFGKAEAEGSGLRNTFVRAIDSEIPVLTAVRPPYTEAWERFHGGLAIALPPEPEAVHAWCRGAARSRTPRKRLAGSLI